MTWISTSITPVKKDLIIGPSPLYDSEIKKDTTDISPYSKIPRKQMEGITHHDYTNIESIKKESFLDLLEEEYKKVMKFEDEVIHISKEALEQLDSFKHREESYTDALLRLLGFRNSKKNLLSWLEKHESNEDLASAIETVYKERNEWTFRT